jgi:DNA ligase-1
MQIVFDETLFGITKNGSTYSWHIYVQDNDGIGVINIERGLIDGKKHVTQESILSGKNLGKVNATTPVSQAIFNAESKRNNKLDSGYDYTVEGSHAKFNDLLKPMLAQSYDKHKKKLVYPCYTQPKLDGIRCLARRRGDTVTLYSRKGKVLDLVPHINKALLSLLEDGQCADGELYTYGWDFQKIISAIKKTNENTPGIQYWIYDLPNMDNRDEPFHERFSYDKVHSIVKASGIDGCLVPVETPIATSEENLMMFEDRYIKRGFEGSMARNKESKYLFGYRSKDLLKVKRFLDDEYKIIGFTHGTSIELECLIFVCETPEGETFSVRPVGTHEERKVMYKNGASYIGKLLTVKYQELSNDKVPRFPVGLHVREDWDMGGER